MYPYINGVSVYDIIGAIDILILMISGFFVIKGSKFFIGNTSEFLMKYFSKVPNKNYITNKLSTEKFWERFEKSVIYIVWIISYLAGDILFKKILDIGKDYYSIVYSTLILMIAVAYYFRRNIFQLLDLISPYFALHSYILKFCCFFHGCCNGYECSFGFYNVENEAIEFPVQLVEGFISLVIFFVLIFLRKKMKEGSSYPLFLIMYSIGRMAVSILRADDKIFGFITKYQIMSFVGLITGILIFIIISKYKKEIADIFNREPFPGYMKYKRNIKASHKVHHKNRKS